MSDPVADVRAALASIVDPETGRDLVAMGMIYDIAVEGDTARVTMTTTVRGCPLSGLLRTGAETAVAAVPGIAKVEITMTWDPPWTPDRMQPL